MRDGGLSLAWLRLSAAQSDVAITSKSPWSGNQLVEPFMYDPSLNPMADRRPAQYGFPSVESYMAVIIYGYAMYYVHENQAMQVTTAFMVIFITATDRAAYTAVRTSEVTRRRTRRMIDE